VGTVISAAVELTPEEPVLRRLADAHLRLTSSRRGVLAALARSGRPLTLPEVLGSEPTLSQSSAYRNLAELIEAGIVHRIDTGGEHSRYELAEDLTEHHHHLICTACGDVLDVDLGDEVERALETAGDGLRQQGIEVSGHRIDLLGRCADCLSGTRRAAVPPRRSTGRSPRR
jgi:Fe2+ or Zn2+ uptake regulation protein